MQIDPPAQFEREFDPKDNTLVTFTWQSASERDRLMRTFGPLPPTKRLSIEYPDGPAGMRVRFRVVDAEAKAAPAAAPAKPEQPAPDSIPAEVLSRARALETWKRADLETRAAEVGVAVKKNMSNAALASMIAQAEHEKK